MRVNELNESLYDGLEYEEKKSLKIPAVDCLNTDCLSTDQHGKKKNDSQQQSAAFASM